MAEHPTRPYVGGPHAARPAAQHAPFVLLPPYIHGRARATAPAAHAAVEPESMVIPPIAEFLDELPSIDDFAPGPSAAIQAVAPVATDWPRWAGEEEAGAGDAGEWGSTDWQRYDWSSAGAIGTVSPDSAAAHAWAATNWDNPRDPRTSQATAAEALADALDQIATRIRTGELSVPGTDRVRDDAAIAATLAKLLGVRR
jgi:hypothetical protein